MKKNCVICGKEFEARNSRELTCGNDCSKQLMLLRKRQWTSEWLKDPNNYSRKLQICRKSYYKRIKSPEIKARKLEAHRKWRANNKSSANAARRRWRCDTTKQKHIRDYEKHWKAKPENRERLRLKAIQSYRQKQISTNLFKLVADLNKLKQHLANP